MAVLDIFGLFVRLIKTYTNDPKCRILAEGEVSETFRVRTILWQGNEIALFNLTLKKVIRTSRVNGPMHIRKNYKTLAYANDIVILEEAIKVEAIKLASTKLAEC